MLRILYEKTCYFLIGSALIRIIQIPSFQLRDGSHICVSPQLRRDADFTSSEFREGLNCFIQTLQLDQIGLSKFELGQIGLVSIQIRVGSNWSRVHPNSNWVNLVPCLFKFELGQVRLVPCPSKF